MLEAAPSLQVVARAGVGLDNIDITAADEFGVVVVAALGANATVSPSTRSRWPSRSLATW